MGSSRMPCMQAERCQQSASAYCLHPYLMHCCNGQEGLCAWAKTVLGLFWVRIVQSSAAPAAGDIVRR